MFKLADNDSFVCLPDTDVNIGGVFFFFGNLDILVVESYKDITDFRLHWSF